MGNDLSRQNSRISLIGPIVVGCVAGFSASFIREMGEKCFPQFISSELRQLILCLVMGAAVGLLLSLPTLIKRWKAKEPLSPKKTKSTPPSTWPLGAILFGLMAAMSFCIHRPIFGGFFTVLGICYLAGLSNHLWKKRKCTEEQL